MRNNIFRNAVIPILAAGALSIAPMAAQDNPMNQYPSRPGMENRAAPPQDLSARMQQFHERQFRHVADLLNLTPDQQTKARQIFQQARASAGPIMPRLRQNRQEIAALVQTGSQSAAGDFNAKLSQLSQDQGSLVAQLITIRTQAMRQFYGILTPGQQRQATDLYALMRSRTPFDMGMAPESASPTD